MLALLSSLPLTLCLSQSTLRATAPAHTRARPAVAVLTELPPGFETLMPTVAHRTLHTPHSSHMCTYAYAYAYAYSAAQPTC